MKVEVHAMCWNEEQILPFFLKHYQTIADEIIIHDNYSTDKSRDIAEDAGCEVWLFGESGMNDVMRQEIKNTAWKGSNANWVIMADMDEFLKVDRFLLNNARIQGSSIFHVQGYDMYSEAMPRASIWELNEGLANASFSKTVIFDPRAITDMNYTPGSHACNPQGRVDWADETLPLYHYHAIGGLNRFLEKRYIRARRQSPTNRRLGHSIHYSYPPGPAGGYLQPGHGLQNPPFRPTLPGLNYTLNRVIIHVLKYTFRGVSSTRFLVYLGGCLGTA